MRAVSTCVVQKARLVGQAWRKTELSTRHTLLSIAETFKLLGVPCSRVHEVRLSPAVDLRCGRPEWMTEVDYERIIHSQSQHDPAQLIGYYVEAKLDPQYRIARLLQPLPETMDGQLQRHFGAPAIARISQCARGLTFALRDRYQLPEVAASTVFQLCRYYLTAVQLEDSDLQLSLGTLVANLPHAIPLGRPSCCPEGELLVFRVTPR